MATVLDGMKLMSEEGVRSVAVVDEETGMIIGGVSVTDIGRVRCHVFSWKIQVNVRYR
jgi:CBS domain-containing protein